MRVLPCVARSHVSPGGGCLGKLESAARPGLANVPGMLTVSRQQALWAHPQNLRAAELVKENETKISEISSDSEAVFPKISEPKL